MRARGSVLKAFLRSVRRATCLSLASSMSCVSLAATMGPSAANMPSWNPSWVVTSFICEEFSTIVHWQPSLSRTVPEARGRGCLGPRSRPRSQQARGSSRAPVPGMPSRMAWETRRSAFSQSRSAERVRRSSPDQPKASGAEPLATLRTACLRVVRETGMPSGAFAGRDGRGEAEAAGWSAAKRAMFSAVGSRTPPAC